jgi:hypothetical protein
LKQSYLGCELVPFVVLDFIPNDLLTEEVRVAKRESLSKCLIVCPTTISWIYIFGLLSKMLAAWAFTTGRQTYFHFLKNPDGIVFFMANTIDSGTRHICDFNDDDD